MNYNIRISLVNYDKKESRILEAVNISEKVLLAIIEKYAMNPTEKVEIWGTEEEEQNET